MAKVKQALPDTVLTVTLPGEGGLQREGTILAQRGTLATVVSFTYSSIGDIADAIEGATARLASVEQAPPKLDAKATGWKDYKPDLEAKRKQLVPGVTVRTDDGLVGTLVENPDPSASVEPDVFFVDAGKHVKATYSLSQLTIVKQGSSVAGDPLSVKGVVKNKDKRPLTDVTINTEKPAQLALI